MPPGLKLPKRVVYPSFTSHNINLPPGCFAAKDVAGAPAAVGDKAQFLMLSSDRAQWEWFADERSADTRAAELNAEARAKQQSADAEYAEAVEAWNEANQ